MLVRLAIGGIGTRITKLFSQFDPTNFGEIAGKFAMFLGVSPH